MKNLSKLGSSALAVMALAGAGAVHAQSSVTIYGVMDVFVEYGKGNGHKVSLESGGLSGSRLGFKGTEDLGGGLSAIFQLESGINADTGTPGQGGIFFGRQSLVGLKGGFGSVTLGRQYTPLFLALDGTDAFGTGAGSPIESGVVSAIFRVNNSIVYSAPKLGGFTVNGMIGLGEVATGTNPNGTQRKGDFGNLYSIDARYGAGPIDAGITLLRRNRGAVGETNATYTLLSGGYDFGMLKLSGGYQNVKNVTQLANTNDDRREAYFGVSVPLTGADTLTAGAGVGKTKDVGGSRASQYSLGIDHALSKRTDVYAVATTIKNGSLTALTPAAATGGGNFPVNAGQRASALQVGVRHRF